MNEDATIVTIGNPNIVCLNQFFFICPVGFLSSKIVFLLFHVFRKEICQVHKGKIKSAPNILGRMGKQPERIRVCCCLLLSTLCIQT